MYFEVEVRPDSGYWSGGAFQFTIQIAPDYPMTPPKVLCKKVKILNDHLENIPPKHRFGGKGLPQHLERGLEAR